MKRLRGVRRRVGALGALVLVGCGGSSSSSTGPSVTTGSLTVTITAPAGVTPSVTVSGPAGFKVSLSATQTVSGLAVGSYTVTAASDTVPNAIVSAVYDGAVFAGTVSVSAGATATASVTYLARPGSGALWVVGQSSSSTDAIVTYTAAELAGNQLLIPAGLSGTSGGAYGAAFDGAGNLWVTHEAGNAVVEFAAGQLMAGGTPTPAVTLSATGAGSLASPTGLAFDAGGNLWVANYGNNTLVEFAVSQLAASGSPTPAVTLSLGALSGPTGLAFDAGGNLWVAKAVANSVVELAAAQLGVTGTPAAAVTLSPDTNLAVPAGLAFDASGSLWVASEGVSKVLGYSPSQLATGGTLLPAVVLVANNNNSLFNPVGLAFDASGNLWVSNYGSSGAGNVVEFAANQLVGVGLFPTPVGTLPESSFQPAGLAFDPPPADLPLR